MAVAFQDKTILFATTNDATTEPIVANAILFTTNATASTSGANLITIKDGNGTNTLFTIPLALQSSFLMTFARPQMFPNGLEFETGASGHQMIVFLQ